MAILEEHGLFWWHTETVPEGYFAPEESVVGHITIEDDGSATLDLPEMMPGDAHPMEVVFNTDRQERRTIQGVLRISGKYVLLSELTRFGGQVKFNGISYYKFRARNCVLGSGRFSTGDVAFSKVQADLAGMESLDSVRSLQQQRAVLGDSARLAALAAAVRQQ